MGLFRRERATPRNVPVVIRRGGPDDLDAICLLLVDLIAASIPRRKRAAYSEAVRQDQAKRLADPSTAWFVANKGGSMVGCARAEIRTGHPLLAYLEEPVAGYLFGVFVTPDERGKGTGKRLVGACEDWLREKGARWAFLHSAPEALRFYENLGFDPTLELARKL